MTAQETVREIERELNEVDEVSDFEILLRIDELCQDFELDHKVRTEATKNYRERKKNRRECT